MATKILRLKLKNFVGIHKGLGLTEIEIDFSKSDHRLVLLLGGNGKGKTTIQSTLHPFSGTFDIRTSSFILEGKTGVKEIDIVQDGRLYKIVHTYADKKNKSFIKRVEEDGTENELNAAGTVRSFVPIIQEELGLTEEFFKLIKVGSQTENFIDLESSKRKDFIGKFTPDISPYLDAFKIVAGKYTASNRDIRFLADELGKLETHDAVSKNIGILRSSVGGLKDKLAALQGESAVLESKLSDSQDVLEENNELIAEQDALLDTIMVNEEKIDTANASYKGKMVLEGEGVVEVQTRLKNYDKKLSIITSDLSNARIEYATAAQQVRSLNDNISRNRNEINTLTNGSDGNIRELQARGNSLVTDFDAISKGRWELEGYPEVFEEADVSNASMLTSSVKSVLGNLITFINTNQPASLSEFIEVWTPSDVNDLISIARSNIESNTKKIKGSETKLKSLESEKDVLVKETYAAKSAADLLQYCSKGTECCLYQRVQDLNKDSSSKAIEELDTQIAVAKKYIREKTMTVSSNEEVLEYGERLQSQDRTSEELKLILGFINEETKQDFSELSDALLHVNISLLDTFADQLDKDVVRFKLMTRLKSLSDSIERNKRSLAKFSESEGTIALLENNISEDNKKLMESKFTSGEVQSRVSDLEVSEKRYTTIVANLNLIIDAYSVMAVSNNDLKVVNKRIAKLEKAAAEVLASADTLKTLKVEIKTTEEEIELVEDDLNRYRLALARIDEFVERKEKLEKDRKKYSVIKDSLDIRLGIPLVLVGDYLNDIRDTTNALLDVVFRGKFYIDFDISDKAFSVPVYNNGICTAGDILLCSQGEISLVKTSLSLGIVIQAISSLANQYNIVQLDEIDAQLDSSYRMTFLQMLDKQLDALNSEQCFAITHNDCFFSSAAGLVILPGHTADITDDEFMSNKDIVADFS